MEFRINKWMNHSISISFFSSVPSSAPLFASFSISNSFFAISSISFIYTFIRSSVLISSFGSSSFSTPYALCSHSIPKPYQHDPHIERIHRVLKHRNVLFERRRVDDSLQILRRAKAGRNQRIEPLADFWISKNRLDVFFFDVTQSIERQLLVQHIALGLFFIPSWEIFNECT